MRLSDFIYHLMQIKDHLQPGKDPVILAVDWETGELSEVTGSILAENQTDISLQTDEL